MASEIAPLCRAFCRALYAYTGGLPEEWRSIRIIGNLARIHASVTLAAVVTYGTKAGWLMKAAPDRVALTDKGRQDFGKEKRTLSDGKSRIWIIPGRR